MPKGTVSLMALIYKDIQDLEENMILPNFNVPYERWTALISERMPDYLAMSSSSEIIQNVVDYLNGFELVQEASEGTYSSGAGKMTTSMSFTTASTQDHSVAATSGKRPQSPGISENDYDEDDPFAEMCLETTGKQYSYICSFAKGFKYQKFGLEEQNLDRRVRMYTYNPKYCTGPTDAWKHRIREIDVTYAIGSPMDQKVSEIMKNVTKDLKQKGASLSESVKKSKWF